MALLRTYYPIVHRKAVPSAELPVFNPSSVIPPRKPVPKPQPTLEIGDRPQQNHGDQPHLLRDSASDADFCFVNGLLHLTSYDQTNRTANLVPDRDRPVALFSLDDLLDGQSFVFRDEDEDQVAEVILSTLDLSDSIQRHREQTLRVLTQNKRKSEEYSSLSPFKSSDALPNDGLHTNDASLHDSLLEPDDSFTAKPEPTSINSFDQVFFRARHLENKSQPVCEHINRDQSLPGVTDPLDCRGGETKTGVLSKRMDYIKRAVQDWKSNDFTLKLEEVGVKIRAICSARKNLLSDAIGERRLYAC